MYDFLPAFKKFSNWSEEFETKPVGDPALKGQKEAEAVGALAFYPQKIQDNKL